MRRLLGCAGIVCLLIAPELARAQTTAAPAAAGRSVGIGGELFYDFTQTTAPTTKDADGNTISPNAFNVSRARLDVSGHLSDRISFRIAPDVVRDTATTSALNGSLTFRL